MIEDEAVQIQPYGDSAILITVDTKIDPIANQKVIKIDRFLQQHLQSGFIETIPAYSSLVITYDPLKIRIEKAISFLETLIKTCPDEFRNAGRLVEVPVIYGGSDGEDLNALAKWCGLGEAEVINLHSQVEYKVAMMGFTPGFVYLSGLDERLQMPRRSTPRTSVPAGTVGIAGAQTGIYSIESPGGWQLIGSTSLTLFDPLQEDPFLFKPGDNVRFIPC